jgi:methyl-accepting chemotaxis protein
VQVNLAVDQVAQVVQQNSATSEQSAAASQQMSSQAQVLQQLILQFKLKDGAGGAIGGGYPAAPPRRRLEAGASAYGGVQPNDAVIF